MLLTPAQIKPKSFESRWNSFFAQGGCASCLRACLGDRLLPQSYQYPNLSEGADRVGGQLRGDKECPFSGVTKSARVWRKVPESDARSVSCCHGLEETIAVHWTQIVKYSLVSVSVVLLARWLWNRTPGTVYREVT